MDYDRELISQSVAKQYHILPSEQEELSYSDWSQLVAGLMHDTPLGRIVSIRAEKDKKTIDRFGSYEKRVRSEWQNFRSQKMKQEYTEADKLAVAEMFEKMFAKMFA